MLTLIEEVALVFGVTDAQTGAPVWAGCFDAFNLLTQYLKLCIFTLFSSHLDNV